MARWTHNKVVGLIKSAGGNLRLVVINNSELPRPRPTDTLEPCVSVGRVCTACTFQSPPSSAQLLARIRPRHPRPRPTVGILQSSRSASLVGFLNLFLIWRRPSLARSIDHLDAPPQSCRAQAPLAVTRRFGGGEVLQCGHCRQQHDGTASNAGGCADRFTAEEGPG